MPPLAKQLDHHHRAAQLALRQGRLKAAHEHCLAILRLDGSHADAWFLCGVIAANNGQTSKSVAIINRAIELTPDRAEYHAELGRQLIALHQPEQALRAALDALALPPADPPTLNTLGTVLSRLGEHEKALSCFESAVNSVRTRPPGGGQLSPAWQADLYFNLAVSLKFGGRFDAAEAAFEQAITLQPRLYKAHSGLAQLRRQTPQRNHLARLQSLRGSASSALDQLHLGHALAKEQEDLGQYSAALASLAWGKSAQAARVGYRAAADHELFSAIKQVFTRELFSGARAQSTGCDSQEPIFIVGMPRTGTTLVERIIGSHSRVHAAGELQNFPLMVSRMTGRASTGLPDQTTLTQALQLDLAELGSAYVNSTRPGTGRRAHFTDKLPLNFLYLGLIRLALPGARLVCLRRDPMDTCLSNYRQLFATDFGHYDYSYDLLDCGRYYLQFDQLIRHWQAVLPGGVLELDYQELVAHPERVARELLDYCGLPWEPQCLDFHQRAGTVATASAVQVRQPVYQTSVNRWRLYGEGMQALHDLLRSAGCYR